MKVRTVPSSRSRIEFGAIQSRNWIDPGSNLDRSRVEFASIQDRILIDFKSILGPLVGASRPQLGSLRASWGGLGASCGGPWAIVSTFITDLTSDPFSDFILHRFRTKTTPKSMKNQSKSHAKIN